MPIVSPIPQPGGSEVGQKKRYVRHQGSTDEIFCHPPVRLLFRSSRCSSTAGPNHHLAAVTTVGTSSGYRPASAIWETSAENIIWLSDSSGRAPKESKSR